MMGNSKRSSKVWDTILRRLMLQLASYKGKVFLKCCIVLIYCLTDVLV